MVIGFLVVDRQSLRCIRLFDPFHSVLSPKAPQRLLDSWRGVFRYVVLELISAGALAKHFAPVTNAASSAIPIAQVPPVKTVVSKPVATKDPPKLEWLGLTSRYRNKAIACHSLNGDYGYQMLPR